MIKMGEALKTVGAFIGLILVTFFAWALYTTLIMIMLAGIFTIFDTVFQYFAVGTPFPDWWVIAAVISGVIGVFEFYEHIVKRT